MRSNEARRLKNANKKVFGMLGDYLAIYFSITVNRGTYG